MHPSPSSSPTPTLTKYTHSCVRLERPGGGTLVIDAGIWSEPAALTGADAVLVTHEHADHVDLLRLRGLGVPVHAPAAAHLPGLDFIAVTPGEEFTAAGFHVTAHGGQHARIHGDLPDCANLGYLVDDAVYHPGDSLHRPDRPVDTLLVPLHASCAKGLRHPRRPDQRTRPEQRERLADPGMPGPLPLPPARNDRLTNPGHQPPPPPRP